MLLNWHKWNKFRIMCDQHHRLGVVIRLTENVPIEYKEDYKRWAGEPVRGIILPKSIFRLNKRLNLKKNYFPIFNTLVQWISRTIETTSRVHSFNCPFGSVHYDRE